MALHNNKLINSILLVDDNADSLDLYSQLLKRKLRSNIIVSRHPGEALKLAHDYFFDFVIIDVTINYKGTQFGGLELYKGLLSKYGDSSLIAYSQFITDDLLEQYGYDFNFIESGTNIVRFISKLSEKISSLRKRQSCFVAMPFGIKYDQVFNIIETCVRSASYRCIRVDRQYFTKSIIEQIFQEIYKAKFLVFLAADQNPNAFYECGYAVALNKEVITLTDIYKNLPFDIRDRNAIAYRNNLKKLKSDLIDKLSNLTFIHLR